MKYPKPEYKNIRLLMFLVTSTAAMFVYGIYLLFWG